MFRIILITCATTPYSLAFPETYSDNMMYFDLSLNGVFFFDLIVNFMSAY